MSGQPLGLCGAGFDVKWLHSNHGAVPWLLKIADRFPLPQTNRGTSRADFTRQLKAILSLVPPDISTFPSHLRLQSPPCVPTGTLHLSRPGLLRRAGPCRKLRRSGQAWRRGKTPAAHALYQGRADVNRFEPREEILQSTTVPREFQYPAP